VPAKITVPNSFFHFLVIFALFALVTGVFAVWNQGEHLVWHDASEIKLSVGGVYYDLQETMDDLLAQMGLRITGVTAGTGLTGGGTSGNVTLNVNTGTAATTGLEILSDEIRLSTAGCIAGEVLKRNAANSGWDCVADNSGTGTITGVTAGAGLTGGGTSGNVTLNVNTGTAATTGIEIVSDQVRLLTAGCAAGEVLKRNSLNNGWECVSDLGPVLLVKTVDESKKINYGFGYDDVLTMPVKAGEIWEVEVFLVAGYYGKTDFYCRLYFPTVDWKAFQGTSYGYGTTANEEMGYSYDTYSQVTLSIKGPTNSVWYVGSGQFKGIFKASADGDFKVGWMQETLDMTSPVTLEKGSYLKATKLN
jgi:hypothetical protein